MIILDKVDKIIDKHRYEKSELIGILQGIQEEMNYLPPDAIRHTAKRLNLPLSQVYGIATFYKRFSLTPRGRYTITVCCGTACHVRGAPKILEELKRQLCISPGETTSDLNFSLETVNCVGACALGPVILVNQEYYGQMNCVKVGKLLERYTVTKRVKAEAVAI